MCPAIAYLFARAQAFVPLLSHFLPTLACQVIAIRAMAKSAAKSEASAARAELSPGALDV